VEAIRTIYDFDLILTSFSNVGMAVDTPKTKEVAFTLITNQKQSFFLSFVFL